MKKMFFPENINVGSSGYIAGKVNEVVETPGSVDRWLNRGCNIVEDSPIIENKIGDVKVEDVGEVIVEEKIDDKKVKKPSKKNKK